MGRGTWEIAADPVETALGAAFDRSSLSFGPQQFL